MKSFSIMCSKIGAVFVLCLVLAVFLFAPISSVVVTADSDKGCVVAAVSLGGDEIPVSAVVPAIQNENIGVSAVYVMASAGLFEPGGGKVIFPAKETTLAPTILMKTAKTVIGLHDEGGGTFVGRLSQGDHPVGVAYEDSGGSAGKLLYSDVPRKTFYTAYTARQSI